MNQDSNAHMPTGKRTRSDLSYCFDREPLQFSNGVAEGVYDWKIYCRIQAN